MTALQHLPVAVIGAGPVGLAAAAHLISRGIPVRVFESGDTVAAHVRSWGHVRLFSPWRYNTDLQAVALLSSHGWTAPEPEALPTGRELLVNYLEPLAQTPPMRDAIETQAYVRSVARHGIHKVVSRGREDHPFVLTVQGHYGDTRHEFARAVIDASGTWQNPNPLGASGAPALGEVALEERASYGIPDVLGEARDHFSGLRVLVVGGGHSAANALLDLTQLAKGDPHLRLTWAVRSTDLTRVFGGGAADQLPARGKLGAELKALVASGRLKLVTGFAADSIEDSPYGFTMHGRNAVAPVAIGPVDRVIVATGQRPDVKMTRELRLDLDPWLECPRALGPMIDPNLHSCGTVPPHGYKELAHLEPNFFTAGVKSYGRAPTFLMATGYEQVRSIAAHLAGDHAAANDVRLVLPETGVCSVNLVPADSESADACCGGPAPKESAACCAEDATAVAQGEAGCGCAEPAKPVVVSIPVGRKSACCAPKADTNEMA